MHLDVLDLRQFYYRTSLGRVAQAAVRSQVTHLWPPLASKGDTVLGFGFAVPMLRPYLPHARRVVGLMPGPQGVMHWPAGRANVSVLCEETLWPLETGSVDKLICLHGLETSDHPSAVLDEVYRVLGPGGRVMFIVPNRAGLWARRDGTPFGFGRPYSQGQLDTQLRIHGFVPERHATALYAPPSSHRFWMRYAPLWEQVGRKVSPVLRGGVFLVEARKQVPRPDRRKTRSLVRNPLGVLEGVAVPEPKPV